MGVWVILWKTVDSMVSLLMNSGAKYQVQIVGLWEPQCSECLASSPPCMIIGEHEQDVLLMQLWTFTLTD